MQVWALNIFLYLNFIFNPQGYQALVAAGEPCYGLATIQLSPLSPVPTAPGPQPVCWYDPTNTNSGQ
jgi:hypothetical protein